MKAIIVREYGEPEVMKVTEVDTPRPQAGQILVKVAAVGVNPVETYFRTGKHAHAPKVPFTPGKDAAGIVELVGKGVTRWKPGDRVYTANSVTGTYAEFTICNKPDLGRLPDSVGFEEGAGLWTPYATAYRALFQKANAKSGETVLVHGASGGVGLAAIQWAKRAGLRVIGTASSDEGKALVAEHGVEAVYDHKDESHLAAIREFTGQGVDVVVEMLADVNLERDFEALAMFGRIVTVGSRGSLTYTPRLAMTKEATIYGMSLFNSSQAARDEIHAEIFKGLSDGSLRPVVRKKFSLEDAPKSHHEVIESKAAGKIVLIP